MSFRDVLIGSVDPVGREEYADTLPAFAEGREGEVTGINLRIIKGIQSLELPAALLTPQGIATANGRIVDCGAAVVQKKSDGWHRYSGKDTPHITRIVSDYNPDERAFSLASHDDLNAVVVSPRWFHDSIIQPREGEIIEAKFGNQGMLQGVLESGPLTEHIRECLSAFETRVEDLGVLLRHPTFLRPSDTRSTPVADVNTLHTDGTQIHGMNVNTLAWQNQTIGRHMVMKNYRAGLEFGGPELHANVEDLIYGIRLATSNEAPFLFFTSLTPRCKVPQRDLATGEVQEEPKNWLRKHRPIRPDKHSTMGANIDKNPEFDIISIRKGDKFIVESEKTTWNQ